MQNQEIIPRKESLGAVQLLHRVHIRKGVGVNYAAGNYSIKLDIISVAFKWERHAVFNGLGFLLSISTKNGKLLEVKYQSCGK